MNFKWSEIFTFQNRNIKMQ